jgi:hypothetical protein
VGIPAGIDRYCHDRGSHDFYGITLGFALASLGFGLFRPGFTTGASLAVSRHEQGDVAGKIASINGAAYIFAPAIGVALFNWWEPALHPDGCRVAVPDHLGRGRIGRCTQKPLDQALLAPSL